MSSKYDMVCFNKLKTAGWKKQTSPLRPGGSRNTVLYVSQVSTEQHFYNNAILKKA